MTLVTTDTVRYVSEPSQDCREAWPVATGTPGRDVTIRVPGGPVSYATVVPGGSGSIVTLWVRRNFEDKGLPERLKEGC